MKEVPKGLHLHFDPISGIAGDMTVAALVDAGVPRAVVVEAIAAMGVAGLKVSFEQRQRGAYVGTGFVVKMAGEGGRAAGKKVARQAGRAARKGAAAGSAPGRKARALPLAHVHEHDHEGHDHDFHGDAHDHDQGHDHDHAHDHDHDHDLGDHGHDHDHDHGGHDHDGDDHLLLLPVPRAKAAAAKGKKFAAHHGHRDYAEIRRMLKRASLDPDTRALAEEIFAGIAEAESALHGIPVDRIAFHEVGAYDSIADIVGSAAAIVHLRPASISSSPPVVGSGHVRTAHGPVPIPAPATAFLLTGIPMVLEGRGELTTPTGAGILAAVVDDFGAAPPMRLVSQGFGAGTRDTPERANVLRVLLGAPLGEALPESAADVVLLETNVDDMNPQLVAPLLEALLVGGAVDAWATPILMKKGRPALTVSALAPAAAVEAVTRAFFENSSTIGVRRLPVARTTLARSRETVKTAYGPVAVKLSAWEGRVLSATPEFDDCRRLAATAKVPVRAVLAAAAAAAQTYVAGPDAKTKARPRRR